MNPLLTTEAGLAKPHQARMGDAKALPEEQIPQDAERAAFDTVFQAMDKPAVKVGLNPSATGEDVSQDLAREATEEPADETLPSVQAGQETDVPDAVDLPSNTKTAEPSSKPEAPRNAGDLLDTGQHTTPNKPTLTASKLPQTASQGAEPIPASAPLPEPIKATPDPSARTPVEHILNSPRSGKIDIVKAPITDHSAKSGLPAPTMTQSGMVQESMGRLSGQVQPAQPHSSQSFASMPDARQTASVVQGAFTAPVQPKSAQAPSGQTLDHIPGSEVPASDRREPTPLHAPDARGDTKPAASVHANTKPTTIQTALSASIGDVGQFTPDAPGRLIGEASEGVQWDLRIAQAGTNAMTAAPVGQRTDMPPQVAQQIAMVLHKAPDKPVEIALNPPELGRVRMVMNASETGVVVQVLTERTDTLDLMRRNIDELGRALADLGYEDISFSFGQGERDSAQEENGTVHNTLQLEHEDAGARNTPTSPLLPTLAIAPDGIDIRL